MKRKLLTIVFLALSVFSTSNWAWSQKVSYLWTSSGQLRFILQGCEPYYYYVTTTYANDIPGLYDLLLSVLLSDRKVEVYSTAGAAYSACPTANTSVGNAKVAR